MTAAIFLTALSLASAAPPRKCPPVGYLPTRISANGSQEFALPTADLRCLIGQLSDPDPAARFGAAVDIRSLATVRYTDELQKTNAPLKDAVPALESVLADVHEYVRTSAAVTLAKIQPDDSKALPILMQALKEGDTNRYQSAAMGLGYMGKNAKSAVPELLKAPDGDVLRMKLRAAEALIEIDPSCPEIVEMLKSCITSSPHEGVREAAIDDLRKLGPRAAGAIPTLVAVVEDGPGDSVEAAKPALGAIGPAANQAVPALAKDSGGLAVPSLIAIGTEDAFKALTSIKDEQSARSALAAMIQHDKRAWVKRFLESRKDPNWKDYLGRTPLHDCAALDRPEIARILLAMGADLDAVFMTGGRVGGTPLHDAVRYRKPAMARLLVKAGAAQDVKAYDGTPRDIAAKNKDKEILSILGGK